jgi:hypothetical protein
VKRLADQTLYEILEVREDARPEEIQAACDRALSIYGPGSLATYTLMTVEEATLLTSRIEEARATLLDPSARARYDESLQRPAEARAKGSNGAMPAPTFGPFPPVIPALSSPKAAPAAPPPADGEAPPAPPPPAAAEAAPAEPAAPPPVLLVTTVAEPPPAAAAPREEPEPPAAAPKPSPSKPVPSRPIPLERALRADPPAPEPPPSARRASEPPPIPVPPEGVWTGDALRQAREARGLSIPQIAERTKVTRHHIDNIEGERFAALPAPVYLRGILLALARELRLDGQKVARSFLERAAAAKK